MEKLNVAILDLNNQVTNRGIDCVKAQVEKYAVENEVELHWHLFDVRAKEEIANEHFDAYISSGGPGSPLDTEGSAWEAKYFNLIDKLLAHNANLNEQKKHVLFICHSYQLFCRHYNLGKVNLRRRPSFGIFPIHKTKEGLKEPLLKNLLNPYYGADFRKYQVIEPNVRNLEAMGSTLVSIEKERPHVDLERAMMAIRFNDEFFGTQYHPEADAKGMQVYFNMPEKKQQVIEQYGQERYDNMVEHLKDPKKILLTETTIIPNFLKKALPIFEEATV